jgi:hypothetical protein
MILHKNSFKETFMKHVAENNMLHDIESNKVSVNFSDRRMIFTFNSDGDLLAAIDLGCGSQLY